MLIRRLLIPLAMATAAAIGAPSIAQAQPYPPTEPVITVNTGTVVVGGTVIVNADGFEPNEEVSVDVTYGGTGGGTGGGAGLAPAAYQVDVKPLAQAKAAAAAKRAMEIVTIVTADANGHVTVTVRLTQTGFATITLTGLVSGLSASVTVLVVPVLPITGAAAGGLLMRQAVIGAGATVAGVLLVWFAIAWRRRSRTPAI